MSNTISDKSMALVNMLRDYGILKKAKEDITHPELTGGQDNLGAEQTKEINKGNSDGAPLASTEAGVKGTKEKAQNVVSAINDLNQGAEDALAEGGTTVTDMNSDGKPSKEPAGVVEEMNSKVAAFKDRLYKIVDAHVKGMPEVKLLDPRLVMNKIATLTDKSTEEDFSAVRDAIEYIKQTDERFAMVKEACVQRLMYNDCVELANAHNITLKQAAGFMQKAAEANPDMMQEIDDAATVDAVDELAGAEEEADMINAGIEELAANASANLGVDVTPDDIVMAIEDVTAQAEQLGVPPEALLQEALEQMEQGGGMEEVTPEDEQLAEQLIAEADASGISPEEVLAAIAEDVGGEGGAVEEPPAYGTEEMPKEASYKFSSNRAAYVSGLLRGDAW